jgi:hypothetical protein
MDQPSPSRSLPECRSTRATLMSAATSSTSTPAGAVQEPCRRLVRTGSHAVVTPRASGAAAAGELTG